MVEEWLNAVRQRAISVPMLNHMYNVAGLNHDNVIKKKHFPRYRPYARRIPRSPVDSPKKGQWRGALKFSLIYAWTNGLANHRDAGDLRRRSAHHDVIVMWVQLAVGEETDPHCWHMIDSIIPGWTQSHKKYNRLLKIHYCDVKMGAMASQITSLTILNRSFRRRSKKTSKLCITGLCAGNSPVTGEFPPQMASNVQNGSIWWCHNVDFSWQRENAFRIGCVKPCHTPG